MNIYPTAEQSATTRIPVVLTVKDAVNKIKEECPGTAITENYLRQLIKDGILDDLDIGKYLLSVNGLGVVTVAMLL